MIQAEERAHRAGQKRNVNIYCLHGTGTVDDVLSQMIQERQAVISGALDGKIGGQHIREGEAGS